MQQDGDNAAECGGASTCTQTRSFSYDSLSRLLTATNPESGTISYQYDASGNLTKKTDARGVQTDYVYDALNRVTARNYSTPGGTPGTGVLSNYQATPNVSYFYDNLPNAKGKLTKVSSSVSTTEYTAFDILGRVTAAKQTTDGTDYTTSYVYNLSGALIEETYPSGRVVKNTLDADGSLSQVQSRKANDTFRNYANSFSYTAAGAVSSMRLGNGKWENTIFNSRLQPTQIGLGSSAISQNLLRLNYDYGSSQNNGNVLSQTITVPAVGSNAGFTAVQSYTYDELNRLKSATETIGGNQTWKQTFLFDRFGNKNFDAANTTTMGSCPQAVCNPSVDPATNKLVGYGFDASGNTTADAENRTFIYDAENKQVQVNNGINVVGQYFYDGDGKRVKKVVPSTVETTVFAYDASGKMVAEYSTNIEPVATAKVNYLTADHLGSPRVNTDATGAVIARHDYLPFGEEIDGVGGRTAGLNYGDDTIRKQFTGYERDTETSLDFAQARMYASALGRFISPDDFLNDSDVSDSQSWNKYQYVRNNPSNLIDPSGKKARYLITIDTKNKRVTVTAIATIGIWSKNHGQKDLDNAAAKIEAGIEKRWKGEWEEDGWKIDFNAQVSVRVFNQAMSVEDVQATDASVMNIVELADIHGKEESYVEDNKSQSAITKSAPDGFRPDVAKWDYSNSVQTGPDYEPAHEFAHILGSPNGGRVGVDLHAPGSGQARSMSRGDFDSAIGYTVQVYRKFYEGYVATNPKAPAKTTYRGVYRICCHR